MQLVASKSEMKDDMGEEEQELDLEEENLKPRIADLIDHNYYFRQVRHDTFHLGRYNSFKFKNQKLNRLQKSSASRDSKR